VSGEKWVLAPNSYARGAVDAAVRERGQARRWRGLVGHIARSYDEGIQDDGEELTVPDDGAANQISPFERAYEDAPMEMAERERAANARGQDTDVAERRRNDQKASVSDPRKR
jgi:hypothetical protein